MSVVIVCTTLERPLKLYSHVSCHSERNDRQAIEIIALMLVITVITMGNYTHKKN